MKRTACLIAWLSIGFAQSQEVSSWPSYPAELNRRCITYPVESEALGEQGTVLVTAVIEASGVASNVRVKRSSGHLRLDEAAVQAVKCFRFIPGKVNGVPESMQYDAPIKFQL
jgi:protein TonB